MRFTYESTKISRQKAYVIDLSCGIMYMFLFVCVNKKKKKHHFQGKLIKILAASWEKKRGEIGLEKKNKGELHSLEARIRPLITKEMFVRWLLTTG